jgi:hypothetical protein
MQLRYIASTYVNITMYPLNNYYILIIFLTLLMVMLNNRKSPETFFQFLKYESVIQAREIKMYFQAKYVFPCTKHLC